MPVIEDVQEATKSWMQPQRTAGRIGANLQHLARRNRDRGTAAVVGRVLIRDQRVQRVVAAAEVNDDEASRRQPLCLRDCAQEGGSGKTERNRRNAVTDEDSSRYAHGRSFYTCWYSAEPTRRRARPAARVVSCAEFQLPAPACRYDINACCGTASNGAGVTRLSIAANSACGV